MSTHTILVVDDDPNSRRALASLLEDEGFLTAEAASGAEALERTDADVSLVLLDVTMPGVNGLDALAALRARRDAADLPVIMVTARNEHAVASFDRGANDYVTKPIDVPCLMARIRTHLRLRDLVRSKDDFLRIASHDLKNPLAVILLAADTLSADYPRGALIDGEAAELIESIRMRALAMRRLIADFLDLQTLAEGALALRSTPVSVGAVASEVVRVLRPYARHKDITLRMEPPPPLEVLGDARRLTQVIENLVGNAVKFTPLGGRVSVRVLAAGGQVRLEVEDNGPGLTPADMPLLFHRHARTSARPTGGETSNGVGLALCKQMIELQGGHVGAHNNPGGGSTFWFELPATGSIVEQHDGHDLSVAPVEQLRLVPATRA